MCCHLNPKLKQNSTMVEHDGASLNVQNGKAVLCCILCILPSNFILNERKVWNVWNVWMQWRACRNHLRFGTAATETNLKCFVCILVVVCLIEFVPVFVHNWYAFTQIRGQFIMGKMLGQFYAHTHTHAHLYSIACIFVHSFEMNCLFTIWAELDETHRPAQCPLYYKSFHANSGIWIGPNSVNRYANRIQNSHNSIHTHICTEVLRTPFVYPLFNLTNSMQILANKFIQTISVIIFIQSLSYSFGRMPHSNLRNSRDGWILPAYYPFFSVLECESTQADLCMFVRALERWKYV